MKRKSRKDRALGARPVFCWVFVAQGPPATIYWTTAAATEQICRAMNREYHECGWECVRVKVSVVSNQRTGRMPARLRHAAWKDIGGTAWKPPGCSEPGQWKRAPNRKVAK